VLDVVHRHFRLRSCVNREPFRETVNLELGFCAGPCRGLISTDDYAEIAGRVAAFLGGDDGWIGEKLACEMEACAAALDYEQAAIPGNNWKPPPASAAGNVSSATSEPAIS
jgi:excinuclease ABC subunit C